ncbi:MAG: NAD(P)/FAD-dependent oxidoreductase [Opitutales bacterium]
MKTDVIIIGAGAAGMMCAIEAGKRGRRVVLVDHAEKIGKKILISGGGRCNFTNLHTRPERYLSANPHFCRSALARYTAADFIALVEKHCISYHEKKLGQLFCDDSSSRITAMLMDECEQAGVRISSATAVKDVKHTAGRFILSTTWGPMECSSLVIATGGLSIPKMGASDFGYRIARQFGLNIREPRPGLVPLTWPESLKSRFAGLSGISLDTAVSCRGASFRENILFTHRGLSGPAILQISSYWLPGEPISVDLIPGKSAVDLLTSKTCARLPLARILEEHWPKRFAQLWCKHYAPANTRAGQLPKGARQAIAKQIQSWTVYPSGTEGFRKAEVTAGGVHTAGLSSKSMETTAVPGLFFVGEVVDVTGWLGGYNFQWAWASGYAAGQAV